MVYCCYLYEGRTGMAEVRKRITFHGRVQGVGFLSLIHI